MNLSTPARRLWAILGASAAVGLTVGGCVPRNDDINQVQDRYVRKAIFQTGDEWYHRRTVVESETTNSIIVEGSGDLWLDRVKFDIQEKLLIAYKPYENLPGTGDVYLEGVDPDSFEGTVVAAWPITEHFDIIRSYDPVTGNEKNTIVKNSSDRPWYEREFMTVDWASNQIEGNLYADRSLGWFPISYVSTGTYWTDLRFEPTDPFASRFTDDYVEINSQVLLGMDLLMCAQMVGYSYPAYGNCGFGEAKIRHAFKRVTEPSDFIPREYPDSVVRNGADGRPMYDEETGEVVREPIYNRFGFFRSELPTYDRGYGYTESGRLFRAMMFNLWEKSTDANGDEIKVANRREKPIIYYLNAEYPERYRQLAREVGSEYNRVFTSMVADLKGITIDQSRIDEVCGETGPVRCMYQIRDNDCNESNIQSFVSANPELLPAVERAVCKAGEACPTLGSAADIPAVVGIGNLKTVCTSLEAATLDPLTGKSTFTWQRVGDPNYNMLVWLNNPQWSGWGGYGPMHSDYRTGETVSASAFIRGHFYETTASSIVDYIEIINDETTGSEIATGKNIRQHILVAENVRDRIANSAPSTAYLDRLDSRMSALGTTRAELLKESSSSRLQMNRLERIRGTRLEEPFRTDDHLAAMSDGHWTPNMGEPDDTVKAMANPVGMLTTLDPMSEVRTSASRAMANAGYCFLEAEFDPHWAGLALALKDKSREERYDEVVKRMLKHVFLHELGHNVGLAHNFEGTYDAMNYDPAFWALQDASDDEKEAGRQDEYRHTTVMEYMSAKGAFADFLGKYDEAAIRFGYGNQVQVFDGATVDQNLEGGEALRSWRYLNDYRDIPDHLCGTAGCADGAARQAVLAGRKWVDFNPQDPPALEVPYLFCDNYYNHRTPFCATFDFGSNIREIMANNYVRWSEYFFFNSFSRNRLVPISWRPWSAMTPTYIAMGYLDTVSQYFYYLNATQPEMFRQTDLYEDMAVAMAEGLNMASEIISVPEPYRMCPFPGTSPKTYLPAYFQRDVCDDNADLNSDYAIQAEMIEMPLGVARPYDLAWSDDYDEYQLEYLGSSFDKEIVTFRLGYSSPKLLRFNYSLDLRTYAHVPLYRLFEPELRSFYDDLINLNTNPYNLDQFTRTADQLGSYWCLDPADPTRPARGHFEGRRLIDPVRNTSLPGASSDCLQPAYVYPRLVRNLAFGAMVAAHVFFSSDFDSQLDMGKNMKVYMKGADDDFETWDGFPSCAVATAGQTCVCSHIDPQLNLEYRAVTFARPVDVGGTVELSPGCRLIEEADTLRSIAESRPSEPIYRDRYRGWLERLEYARDMYRTFQYR